MTHRAWGLAGALLLLLSAGCGLFDISKKDRRTWIEQSCGGNVDRARSLAATEALEKEACTFGLNCKGWLGRTRGVCVYAAGGKESVAAYTTYSLRNNEVELEGRSALCDAIRNTVLPEGPASVYCNPASRCSTTCGKPRKR